MSESIINFFKKNAAWLVCLSAIVWVLFFSFQTLTTKPRLWTDESMSIEMARNFSLYGMLDVAVRPGVFSGQTALLQSTGYPVTVPLALFFKIFGFGPVQARVYMIIWMVLLLSLLIFFIRKAFGASFIVWPVWLIASLAPFYANGRCATGEIPGFIFLLLGAYFLWYSSRRAFVSGLFFGLAVVAKPSVYSLLVPAVFLVIFLEKNRPIKKFLSVCSGMLFPAIIWVMLLMPNPFAKSAWADIFYFYKNPFGGMSVWGNLSQNFPLLFQHSTLVYFFGLLAIIVLAVFLNRDFYNKHKNLLNFLMIYYVFALFYFLKSPGWLRYIIAGQLLILLIFPPALTIVFDRLKFKNETVKKMTIGILLLLLVLSQLFHLVYRSDLFSSGAPQRVAEFIGAQPAKMTVGIINAPIVASLIDPAKKFQLIKLLGLPVLGENPLALKAENLPDLIITVRDSVDFKEYESVAKERYLLLKPVGEYDIYRLSSLK